VAFLIDIQVVSLNTNTMIRSSRTVCDSSFTGIEAGRYARYLLIGLTGRSDVMAAYIADPTTFLPLVTVDGKITFSWEGNSARYGPVRLTAIRSSS
jgi:hypothetical protein